MKLEGVVGAIPAPLLGFSSTVCLAQNARAAGGAEDALFTTDGSPDGPSILVEGVVESIPVWSPLGALLTTFLVASGGWLFLRQRLPPSTLVPLLLVLSGVGAVAVAFAAFGDPSATDDTDDSVPADTRAEIFGSFAMPGGGGLALRLDVEDIPVETTCNDATDNNGDGLIDCEDPNCVQQVCSDGNGCTAGDLCLPSGGFFLTCLGNPVVCPDGFCVSQGPDAFQCIQDTSKLEFGF